ncbi:hypothetical protein ATE69_15965 [Sphingopyxis sp. H071]|nr:hypothetical protein ATE69_15965 [Sphingopyxis sp. H071]KTE58392.1 hypothetical protein ATE66_15400 [Sphingopyxis sp. H107]
MLLELQNRSITPLQMFFDRAEADPHFGGNLLLRDTINPHGAKGKGGAFGQCIKNRIDSPKLVASNQQAIRRWLGVAGSCHAALDMALRPLLLARGAALRRAAAIKHQILGGAVKISERLGDYAGIDIREFQPQVLQYIFAIAVAAETNAQIARQGRPVGQEYRF